MLNRRALEERLLRLMNRIAECHRRGQRDIAETLTINAARTLRELADVRWSERLKNPAVHALFIAAKSEN
jgi:hypothetical protein